MKGLVLFLVLVAAQRFLKMNKLQLSGTEIVTLFSQKEKFLQSKNLALVWQFLTDRTFCQQFVGTFRCQQIVSLFFFRFAF